MSLTEQEAQLPYDVVDALKCFRNNLLDFAHLSLSADRNKTFRNLTMNEYNQCYRKIMSILEEIRLIEPCPDCGGSNSNCVRCGGVGFITRQI